MQRQRMASAAWIGIGLWAGIAAASPRADITDLTEVLDRFNEASAPLSCDAREPLTNDTCPRCKKIWDVTSKRSCEELFAERAPIGVRDLSPKAVLSGPDDAARAWVGKTATPLKPESFPRKEWLPFCSTYQLDLQLAKLAAKPPLRAAPDRLATAAQAVDQYHWNRDLCDPRGKYYSMNRYDEKYVAPTQEERKMIPLPHAPAGAPPSQAKSSTEVKTIEDQKAVAWIWIDKVAGECCGSDDECSKYFKRIRLPDCEPKRPKPGEKQSSESDECLDFAAFWEKTEKGYGPDQGDPTWVKSADEPFYPGRMLIAPYAPASDAVTMSLDGLLAHELAHQCSNIHIQLAKYHGRPDAIRVPSEATQGVKDGSCALTEPVKKFYRQRLARVELNDATAECLFERVGRAPELRFRPGTPCSLGCPVIQLDEAYAMLHGFAHTEAVADAVPLYMPGQFCGMRDAEHPMGADVLACAIRTPKFRAKMEGFVKCRR